MNKFYLLKFLFLFFFVFSAPFIRAQKTLSSVILKNGTVLKGYIKSMDPTDAIVIEISGVETKIKMDNIALIEASDQNTAGNDIPTSPKERKAVMPKDPLIGFSGFLLAKGNNVYVYGDDNEAERIAVNELRTYLIMDGFWNVVDNMNEAHFTINYCVESSKSQTITQGNYFKNELAVVKTDPNRVTLSVSSWRSNASVELSKDILENIKSARQSTIMAKKLYNKVIVPFQKDIENNKVSRRIKKKFTIE